MDLEYFNNIVDAPIAPLPDPTGPLLETGLFEAAGKGFLRGATDIAGAATLAVGGLVGLMEGGAFNEKASDSVFKFYEDVIKPAQEYWTPDPESVSTADNIVGGIAGIVPSLMLGPAAIPSLIGTATFGTAVDLVEQGVDPKIATGIGILGGAATGLMVRIPASGETLAKTFGLVLANPVIGAIQTKVQAKALEIAGHPDIAKSFDPFDPTGRSIDLALGIIFGGMGLYAKARTRLPVQFNDAVDTATEVQVVTKSNIVKGKNRFVHENALNDSINKLVDGDKVDVTAKVQGVEFKATTPDQDAIAIRKGHAEWKAEIIDDAQAIVKGDEPRLLTEHFAEEKTRQDDLALEASIRATEAEGEGLPFQEPEQPVSVRARVSEAGREVITDPLFASIDEFMDANPETTIHLGTDETGNARLEKAKTYIDDARAEVDAVEKKITLYDLAAECLTRG